MDDPDRRALLRGLAGAVAAGATTGLAGCSEPTFLDPGGGGADLSYLFEPGTVADGDHYAVRFAVPETVADYDDDLPDATVSAIRSRADWLYEATGTEFDAAAAQLTFRTAAVVELDHDPESVEDELDDAEFEEVDDDEHGYRVFRSADEGRAVGFDGTTLVGARPAAEEPDPEDVVEHVVETAAGEGDRYEDENEAFAATAEELTGDAFYVVSHDDTDDTDVELGLFDDEVARGVTASFADDETDVRVVLAFEDADEVVTEDVEEWTAIDAFEDWGDVSVEDDGAVVTVSGVVDTDAVELAVPRGGGGMPLRWIPTPEELGFDEGFTINRSAPRTLAEMDGVPEAFAERMSRSETASLLSLSDPVVERITAGPFEVVRTDIGESGLAERAREADFERESGYAGSTVYETPDSETALAVDGGTAVFARQFRGVAARDTVETVLDAARGEADRYVDAYEPLATVADRIEVRPVTVYRPNRGDYIDGALASGIQFDLGPDRTRLTIPFVFEDVAAAERSDLEESFAGNLDGFSRRRDGRVVVVTGSVATDELG